MISWYHQKKKNNHKIYTFLVDKLTLTITRQGNLSSKEVIVVVNNDNNNKIHAHFPYFPFTNCIKRFSSAWRYKLIWDHFLPCPDDSVSFVWHCLFVIKNNELSFVSPCFTVEIDVINFIIYFMYWTKWISLHTLCHNSPYKMKREYVLRRK